MAADIEQEQLKKVPREDAPEYHPQAVGEYHPQAVGAGAGGRRGAALERKASGLEQQIMDTIQDERSRSVYDEIARKHGHTTRIL